MKLSKRCQKIINQNGEHIKYLIFEIMLKVQLLAIHIIFFYQEKLLKLLRQRRILKKKIRHQF